MIYKGVNKRIGSLMIVILLLLLIACKIKKPVMTEQNDHLYYMPGVFSFSEWDIYFCNIISSNRPPLKIPIRTKKVKPVMNKLGMITYFDSTRYMAVEKIETIASGHDRRNLVMINPKGEVIERIVQSDDEHHVGGLAISQNNEKLLYTTWADDFSKDTSFLAVMGRVLFKPEAINIMEYPSGKRILHIEKFSRGGALELDDTSWSPDAKRFVYTIDGPGKRKDGGPASDMSKSITGMYIYDIEKQKDIAFVPWVREVTWGSDNNRVAYVKDDAVWIYDIPSGNSTFFTAALADTKISRIIWIPKDNYLYVMYDSTIVRDKVYEKIFDIKSKQEIPHKPTGLPSRYFGWRMG